ncbi:MAG: hypothetical protein EPGJADBJ_02928 [Saprospiraceae bacterium]|nr:hypothetical protein [Saprospiraceae bacterium]
MANAEHLAILKGGVDVWNKWREDNSNISPDLSNANLTSVELCTVGRIDSIPRLIGANLSYANLFGADLSGAGMNFVNLTGTNLSRANLARTNLSNTDLNNANLSRTKLSGANMTYADLSNANLKAADLNIANLLRADLDDSDLTDAKIGGTVFSLTNLSTCRGLETVQVEQPCSIDFQTLRASRNLPKSFLLKIGLPELYLDYLPDFFQPEGIRLYPAFLSHSHANKPFARKLYEALIARGVNVFFDEKKMKPGDDIFTGLSRGIELYDKTILVCSEDSLNSWWVDQELELVFEKERNLQKEAGEKIGLLIPIRIDDHIDTWTNGKRMTIKQRVIGDFRNWQDDAAFEKALDDLIHALNADRPVVKPVSHLPRKTKS